MSDPIMPEQVQTDIPFSITFHFDWPRPPLTANQRMHWREKAEITRQIRYAAKVLTPRIPHFNRIEVTLVWVVKDKRRRDADNIVPTLKALCDGLVDAGVVDDDTPEFMVKHMPIIHLNRDATPHMNLTIREVRS